VRDSYRDSIEQAIQEEGAEGDFEVGDAEFGELSFTPPSVEEARAWQVAIPIEVTSGEFEGWSDDLYQEFVLLRQGDMLAILGTQDESDPFDPGMRDELLQVLADRMSVTPS
jgi:hypothetical protein